MRETTRTIRSHARTLLLLWGVVAIAPLIAIGVSIFCCVTPLHYLIHSSPGMDACQHEPSVAVDERGADPFSRPSSPPGPRLEITALPVITGHERAVDSGSAERARLFGSGDADPPSPDNPSQERLAVFRI